MIITYKKSYKKAFKKLSQKQQRNTYAVITTIFEEDPFHPLLNNHALKGEYLGYRSINITGDLRAIFQEISEGTYEFVEFAEIGTHSQLYG